MAQLNIQNSGATQSIINSRGMKIPTNVITRNLMSQTSDALTCFTQQQFSAKLQAYMLNYVMSVSGNYAVYAK